MTIKEAKSSHNFIVYIMLKMSHKLGIKIYIDIILHQILPKTILTTFNNNYCFCMNTYFYTQCEFYIHVQYPSFTECDINDVTNRIMEKLL